VHQTSTFAPRADDNTPVAHAHRRDWRPCPALYPSPLRPSKPVAVWLYRFADAVLHLETFAAFVAEFPAEFAAGDPVR